MSDQTIPALLQEIEALQAQAGPGASQDDRIAAVTRVEHLLMGNCSQIIEYCQQIEADRNETRKALLEIEQDRKAYRGFDMDNVQMRDLLTQCVIDREKERWAKEGKPA